MNSDSREDKAWIQECLDGHRDAFDKLVAKYQDRVFNLSYRLSGNREDALDLCQDVFLKAYRNLEHFRGFSSFFTWLYRIAVNTALSRRRYNAARPGPVSGSAEGDARPLPPGADENSPDPAEQAAKNDMIRLLERAIAALDAEHRVMIVLRDIEGRNYSEISEMLDCPPGTVKSRLHRARRRLRDMLEDALPTDAWIEGGSRTL